MWISRKKWNSLIRRVEQCEHEIGRIREENKEDLIAIAKRILREPEKLSEELDDMNKIDQFVNRFIHS